jgi:hypothetical protein
MPPIGENSHNLVTLAPICRYVALRFYVEVQIAERHSVDI